MYSCKKVAVPATFLYCMRQQGAGGRSQARLRLSGLCSQFMFLNKVTIHK